MVIELSLVYEIILYRFYTCLLDALKHTVPVDDCTDSLRSIFTRCTIDCIP